MVGDERGLREGGRHAPTLGKVEHKANKESAAHFAACVYRAAVTCHNAAGK
jgi:hypothetical protein